MRKLIVIEGVDASGKATQSGILVDRLTQCGKNVFTMSFPRYNTPTGQVIGGPYLGKEHICKSFFDKPSTVDPLIASLYYTADRIAARDEIISHLDAGKIGVFDRYVESNLAHQGAKIHPRLHQSQIITKLRQLDYDYADMPRPSKIICLLMPYQLSIMLNRERNIVGDGHESDANYLKNAAKVYNELCINDGWSIVQCGKPDSSLLHNFTDQEIMQLSNEEILRLIKVDNIGHLIRSKEHISDEIFNLVMEHI